MAAEQTVSVEIPRIDVKQIEIRLIGDSPLICHKWSEKAKKQMLDKQMKKAKTGKEAKDPWMDYVQSMYWLTPMPPTPTDKDVAKAKFGFPCIPFKSAAVGACRFVDGIKMTEARGAFHVVGELVELAGTPTMREDMVRVGMGTADIRYRGEFMPWSTTLTVAYNPNAMSAGQIVNLFNLAGFHQGVGEMRPEKTGFGYGRYHVG